MIGKVVFISGFKYVLMVAIMLSGWTGHAQKIKYKELHPLLESRQYDLAIPLLKSFLAAPKTTDHPSGNFQLAIFYEEMALKQDILQNTVKMMAYVDSAIRAYEKTSPLLTEKEVSKKNTEYYQSYERRDVRTGEVGIKLSDVRYDIEKKITGLKQRQTAVNNIKKSYQEADSLYTVAQHIFSELQQTYPTAKALFLQADDTVLNTIDHLVALFHATKEHADRMKGQLGKIPRARYDPKITMLPLEDYENEGMTKANFLADEIKLWDYATWGNDLKASVTDEIRPLMNELVTYDGNLEKLRDAVLSDSSSVIGKIVEYGTLENKLLKYDPEPLPIQIFDVKIAELHYLSRSMEHTNVKDSSDVMYQVTILDEEMTTLSSYDSLLDRLARSAYQKEAANYSYYISSTFGSLTGLEQYLTSKKSFATQELERLKKQFERVSRRAQWLISDNDSIPLFEVDDQQVSNGYLPVLVEDTFTMGLYTTEGQPMRGYFSLIDQYRQPKSKVFFELDEGIFSRSELANIKTLVNIDASGQVHHLMLYRTLPDKTVASHLCKIYTADGVAWQKSIMLDTLPMQLTVKDTTGEVHIHYNTTDYSGEKEIPEGIIIDKKGNVVE